MRILLTNIHQLLQVRTSTVLKVSGSEMAHLPLLENAYLLIENDLITDFGLMSEINEIAADEIINCEGRVVLPTWCDSHTHIVMQEVANKSL